MKTLPPLLKAMERFATAADDFEHIREHDPMIAIRCSLSDLRRLRTVYRDMEQRTVADE